MPGIMNGAINEECFSKMKVSSANKVISAIVTPRILSSIVISDIVTPRILSSIAALGMKARIYKVPVSALLQSKHCKIVRSLEQTMWAPGFIFETMIWIFLKMFCLAENNSC